MNHFYKLFDKHKLSHFYSGIILLINVMVISNTAFSQSLLVKTSIESGMHNYTFAETVVDSSTITVFSRNPFQVGGSYEFRVYDHQFSMIKRKQFIVSNDSLTQLCGNGNTWIHTFPMRIFPKPIDSSIYVTTNFTHNYGTCQQLNGLVLMKFTTDFDVVWSRQFSELSNGSIPFNDSTLLIYGGNSAFKVKLSNGDTLWARRSGYGINGAMESFNDTTVYVFGRASVPGLTGNSGKISELSENGYKSWDISIHDSTTSQYFTNGIKTSDSCFAMLSVRNHNTQSQHLGLFKINRQGIKLWEKVYTLPGYYELPWDLFQTSDGGFLITYQANSTTGSFDKILLLKIDSMGIPEWNRHFTGTSYACQSTYLGKIMNLNDEKLLITGGNLIQTDTSGNGCFFSTFNNVNVANGTSNIISNTPSALLHISPQNQIKYNIGSNIFTVVTSPESPYKDSCFVFTHSEEFIPNLQAKIYPNPTNDKFYVSYNIMNKGTLSIADGTLRVLKVIELDKFKTLEEIDVSQFVDGLYYCLINSGDLINVSKLTIIK